MFPLAFYFVLLITVYTMVILGGSGNQAGVVLGALIIGPLLELLRDPAKSRIIFFVALVVGTRARVAALALARDRRASRRSSSASSLHAIAGCDSTRTGSPASTRRGFAGVVDHWVIAPAHLARWIPPVAYVGVIAPRARLHAPPRHLRAVALVPTLYLAAFVWENVMLSKPEPARYIVLGLILIVLMVLRPNGLLGERRVEII